MTQAGLAGRFGLTKSQVSKIERGDSRLGVVQPRTICAAFGSSLVTFVKRLEHELTTPA